MRRNNLQEDKRREWVWESSKERRKRRENKKERKKKIKKSSIRENKEAERWVWHWKK